jgi:hypothetical protein
MVVRKMTRKKKEPKVYSRRSRSGFEAAPQTDFMDFNEYVRTEVDKSEIVDKIKAYIKAKLPKAKASQLLKVPEWVFTCNYGLASTIAWKEFERPFPNYWNEAKVVSDKLAYIESQVPLKIEKENQTKVSRSPMDVVIEKASDFIADIEEVLDFFNTKTFFDWDNYSVYAELQKIDAPYVVAKRTMDYYTPLIQEFEELITKKTPDLVEAYSFMPVKKRKEYLKVITQIVDDCEKYMASKKAVRKSRTPKAKSADKQVSSMNYLKESSEFKVASIDPANIVGARRVYVFNTKYRSLTEYFSETPDGLTVSGTTINGYDVDRSRSIRLRKPDEILPAILSKSPIQIDNVWSSLTTKPQQMTGRINKDVIILRAMDK